MQKKQNASITFPVALGGMNNVLPADMIGQTQATLLENIEYDNIIKQFKGSKSYIKDNNIAEKILKIYSVMYNNNSSLMYIFNDGFMLSIENKKVEVKGKINDVVYNEDGIYLAVDTKLYKYVFGTLSVINYEEFYIGLRKLFTVTNVKFIYYHNGYLYTISSSNLPESQGVYCYSLMSSEENTGIRIINSSNFCHINGANFYKFYNTDEFGVISVDTRDSSYNEAGYKLVKTNAIFSSPLQLVAIGFKYGNQNICEIGEAYKPATKSGNQVNNKYIFYNVSSYKYINVALVKKANIKYKNKYKTYSVEVGAFFNVGNISDNGNICEYYFLLQCNIKDLQGNKIKSINKYFNFKADPMFTNLRNNVFLFKMFFYDNKVIIFKNDSCFIVDLNIDLFTQEIEYEEFRLEFPTDNLLIVDVTQNNNKFYLLLSDNTIYETDIKNSGNIPFLLINNSRLIVSQNKSLYYSGVGDFNNWQQGTEADALFLEVGYKDGGDNVAGISSYGSIIVFKNNGYIYRVSGDYPNWVVNKLGETSKITSNIIDYAGTLIFGTETGLKQLSTTQAYGDFIISDFQNNIIANQVINISVNEKRNTIVFCSQDYVFEYHTQLKIFYVYQKYLFNQMIEYNNNGLYTNYALKNNELYIEDDTLNPVTVQRALIHNQYNIVIKAITLYTDTLQDDTEIEIEFYKDKKVTKILKAGQSKHKFFITVRLKELQLKYKHNGSIFINNTIIELMNVGA